MKNRLAEFDKVYLINLERRTDRLNKWLTNNKDIIDGLDNFEIIKAIDGIQCNNTEWKFAPGALGCLESHLKIIIDAKMNNYEKIVIFEDDFIFDENFLHLFNDGLLELPENWHMLYLFSTDYIEPVEYSKCLARCTSTLSGVAYCLNSTIFDVFIGLLKLRSREVDVIYGHSHFIINAFKFKTNICHHFDGFSDILLEQTNYHSYPSSFERLKLFIKRILRGFGVIKSNK